MAKIAFFDVEKQEEEYFKQNFPNDELLFSDQPLELGRELDSNLFSAEVISVFTYSKVNSETLEKFSNLKYVTTRSTGFDHVDIEYCNSKGIKVSNEWIYRASRLPQLKIFDKDAK